MTDKIAATKRDTTRQRLMDAFEGYTRKKVGSFEYLHTWGWSKVATCP